jgi:hypothetical protein
MHGMSLFADQPLERRYRIARDRRALMGISRSTVGALDTCVNGSIAFEACALLAPAILSSLFDTVLPATRTATRLFIETGKYDVPLVTDARALRGALERVGCPCTMSSPHRATITPRFERDRRP